MIGIDDFLLFTRRTVTGMLAAFTMVIASTIVNVAVPDVIGAFGVSQSEVQLMATAFNIAMTTGQLLKRGDLRNI